MSSDSEVDEQEVNLSNPDVVTKHKAAAEICNKAVAAVIEDCKDGAKIVDLCVKGDAIVTEQMSKIFKGKDIEKGLAFPCCVSVNNAVCHCCPLEGDASLKTGDSVKIDLGCHLDGFIAVQAATVVIQDDFATPITGQTADVMEAARTAFQASLRLIRPGKSISDVADVLEKIADAYGVKLVEGVMTHQLKKFVIDGNKCVLNKPTTDNRVEDDDFEANEVYAIDIVMTSGEGKTRQLDEKETTVYKRALDMEYNLKMKASRHVFSEVNKKYPTMPFTTRYLSDPRQTRLGLVECLNHGLLHPYPVLYERSEALVAQVKGTVLLMPNGSDVITEAPQQPVKSEKVLEDEEVKALLQQPIKKAKKKKAKKKPAE
ncbi:hypothetical protein BSKO_03335 [Bryopsis sp. KO-2023]|nr:hypothetical protein BSKO_03335 [Bryopsis sp. KO-2023]